MVEGLLGLVEIPGWRCGVERLGLGACIDGVFVLMMFMNYNYT